MYFCSQYSFNIMSAELQTIRASSQKFILQCSKKQDISSVAQGFKSLHSDETSIYIKFKNNKHIKIQRSFYLLVRHLNVFVKKHATIFTM
jgi:hypothetical protein